MYAVESYLFNFAQQNINNENSIILHEPTPRRGHAHRRGDPAGRGAAVCPHRSDDADDDLGVVAVDGDGDGIAESVVADNY